MWLEDSPVATQGILHVTPSEFSQMKTDYLNNEDVLLWALREELYPDWLPYKPINIVVEYTYRELGMHDTYSSLDRLVFLANNPSITTINLRLNQWFHGNHMSIYCRLGLVYIHTMDQYVHCLTIANVSVEEGYQGKGRFTELLDDLERSPHLSIYVEQIMNPRLDAFLERRGYALIQLPYSQPEITQRFKIKQ